MKKGTAAFAFLLTILLWPAFVSGKEDWRRVRSANFTIVGDASENQMKKLADRLEQFRQSLQIVLPRANLSDAVPTTVYLFQDESSFHPFKPKYEGKIRDNVAGYFVARPTTNYIVLSSEALRSVARSANSKLSNPFQLIFHEYFHFVVQNNLDFVPIWLNEGLAEYYSTFETTDEGQVIQLGSPINLHIQILREKQLLPLETLLTVDRKSPHYNESNKTSIFYAQSWALVHYLALGNNQKRAAQFNQFLTLVSADRPQMETFRQVFQTDPKGMEAELRDYVRKFSFPVLNVKLPKQIDYTKDLQTSSLSEADSLFLQGELLAQLRRDQEAEEYFKKALKVASNHSATLLSLGIIRLRQEKPAEAKKYVEQALAADPRNSQAHYQYARILRQEGQKTDAIKVLHQAISLQPTMAEAFTDLGFLYLQADDRDKALEAFAQAIKLDPQNTNLLRTTSYMLLGRRQGKAAADDAIAYLKRKRWRDEHALYMTLVIHFGSREAHNQAIAVKILSEAEANADTTNWPFPIIRYLKRNLSLSELLALATDTDKLTEVHAYVGLDLLLNGKPEEAQPHFKWVVDHGNRNFVEYTLTLAEMERLQK